MSKSHAPLEETWLAAGSLLARDPVRVLACLAVIVPIFLMLAATLAAESRPTLIWVLCASAVLNCGLALLLVDGQRALLKAREGEKSFRDLYENISEGVFRSTLDGRMISANPSLVRLNGYQTEKQLIKAVNSIADALGQAATHAPQAIHAAASMARSAFSLGTGIALASGALPVGALIKPPA